MKKSLYAVVGLKECSNLNNFILLNVVYHFMLIYMFFLVWHTLQVKVVIKHLLQKLIILTTPPSQSYSSSNSSINAPDNSLFSFTSSTLPQICACGPTIPISMIDDDSVSINMCVQLESIHVNNCVMYGEKGSSEWIKALQQIVNMIENEKKQ